MSDAYSYHCDGRTGYVFAESEHSARRAVADALTHTIVSDGQYTSVKHNEDAIQKLLPTVTVKKVSLEEVWNK